MHPAEAAPPSPCRRPIRPIPWAVAFAACALLGACSNDAGVDIQIFDVNLLNPPSTVVQADGTRVSTISLEVDTDTGHVIGASLLYAVTAGDLSDTTAVSGTNGFAAVTWTVTPAQAAGLTEVTFSACASSEGTTATCTPQPVATLQLTGS